MDIQKFYPNTVYWYRFHVQGYSSEPARTETLPEKGDNLSELRLAQVSCQNYTAGYFNAYDEMESYHLDAVLHLGDYIYETHFQNQVREPHTYEEPMSLNDYRNTYAAYKMDPSLQRAHAHCPWLVTWDDHEVENSYSQFTPGTLDSDPSTNFFARRQAAYQAWWEHMPVRMSPNNLRVHRSFEYGNLAKINILDTRQYRTPNPCDHDRFFGPRCDASADVSTTFLGFEQEAWLADNLINSDSTWQIIASATVVQQWRLGASSCNFQSRYPDEMATVGVDESNCSTEQHDIFLHETWDGYPVARQRMLDDISIAPGSKIFLSGDIHSGWASGILSNFDNPDSDIIANEFVGPALTSNPQVHEHAEAIIEKNPHVQWCSGRGVGWVFHLIRPTWAGTVFRTTPYPNDGTSSLTQASHWITLLGNGKSIRWD